MKEQFSLAEGRVLHGLIEDASGDIVVRLDRAGFIIHASENAVEIGIDASELLLMPHIADLAQTAHAASLAQYAAQIFAGEQVRGWVEFPLFIACQSRDGEEEQSNQPDPMFADRWYALSLRLVDNEDGAHPYALGLLRSVQKRHALEGEINNRALTDPLTGLANRSAFFARLRQTITGASSGSVAILSVDRLRAIFMQYGQRTADEIQWGFAKYLEAMSAPGSEVAQLDADRFIVLLPDMELKQARAWADDVLETFSGLAVTSSKSAPELTASAGLARVELSVDWTMRQAELGLVMAQAGGGMKIGICGQRPRAVACGATVEKAIRQAVERAERRLA